MLLELCCDLLRKPIGIDRCGGGLGAFALVDALRDCLSSWRRRTVMKAFLNVFREFNEIDFRNSRFGSNHDPVRFDTADRSVFVYLAIKCFEVVGKYDRCR